MLEPRNLAPRPHDVAMARKLTPQGPPDVAVVLGSGLGFVADELHDARELPYSAIEGMQGPTHVAGHGGRLVAGDAGGMSVLAFQGRLHTYQGVSAFEAAYPARLAAALGAGVLVVTNAAGGVSESLEAGDVMAIRDHINLLGDNPLRAWPGPEGGVPFVPMGGAYDAELLEIAREVASEQGEELKEGVYAALPGPTYETPAEVSMLRTIGADAAGMSTVPEVIAARALGMRVLGTSLITNVAGGKALSHEEVLEIGRRSEAMLGRLLSDILRRLPAPR